MGPIIDRGSGQRRYALRGSSPSRRGAKQTIYTRLRNAMEPTVGPIRQHGDHVFESNWSMRCCSNRRVAERTDLFRDPTESTWTQVWTQRHTVVRTADCLLEYQETAHVGVLRILEGHTEALRYDKDWGSINFTVSKELFGFTHRCPPTSIDFNTLTPG